MTLCLLSSCNSIPRKRQSFCRPKYWWDEEFSLLKEKAIQSHSIWLSICKSRSGFVAMRQDKARYKLAIKTKECDSRNVFSNSLNDALLSKNMDSFWKSWKSKFGKKVSPTVIDGSCDNKIC